MIELSGEYTDARVMGIDEENVEQNTLEQIQSMIDHEAFTEPVRVMSDCHVGSGAVIGFTMPLGEKVVPTVVGLDIGCGMYSVCIGDDLSMSGEELDAAVRDKVPMGWGPDGLSAPNRDHYHVGNDFPWEKANKRLKSFIEEQDGEWIDEMRSFYESGGYDIEYFKELINERAATTGGYFDMNTAISSVGTLGSGNHFIELGQSVETGKYWVTIHSGSRGVGANTAEYWKGKATEYLDKKYNRDDRADRIRSLLSEYPDEYTVFNPGDVTDEEVLNWVQGGMGQEFINYEAISKTEREKVGSELKQAISIANEGGDTGDSRDYLVGDAAGGYLIDMIFCQMYASESRKMMARAVADVLDAEITDEIECVHNFIDFRDGVIRKGATRAYSGERLVIPFNMRDGTLLVEGKSNPEWNYSAPHGAGRVMSRRQADDEFTKEDLQKDMSDVGAFATVFPTDESPGAYKNTQVIEEAITDTGTITDRLEVVHNWKAG